MTKPTGIQTVHVDGNRYWVHHREDGAPDVYVIKTKRLYQRELGTYKQRITSAPKIKRILRIAATLPTA